MRPTKGRDRGGYSSDGRVAVEQIEGVQLLDVTAAGPLLTDSAGTLRVVAASSERTRLPELEVGFASVHALPMRLRSDVIGELNFFDSAPGALDENRLRVGQSLADIATIGLLQQRAIHRHDAITEQLQTAINSRILIEQAKGLLAERLQVDVTEAFTLLRTAARIRNRRLSDLARAIVDGTEQLPAPPTSDEQASSAPRSAGG